MRIRSKIWLEVGGNTVFGSGRKYLLEGIFRYGSINKAAKDISISYRKALSYIQAMEDRLGLKLVERKTGGKNGGGASLTADAKELIRRYELLEDGVNEMLDRKFRQVFGKKQIRTYLKTGSDNKGCHSCKRSASGIIQKQRKIPDKPE